MVLGSDPFRYKIVRISRQGVKEPMKEYYTYRCEIFDSKTWRWREVERIKVRYSELIIDSVTANNVVYWLTNVKQRNRFSVKANELLSIKFSLPEKVVEKSESLQVQAAGGGTKGGSAPHFLTEDGEDGALWPGREVARRTG
ncbi:hypothetical protein Sango_1217300 [Sesamum angolense]|uniref:Uncharacterized protein n=1 Tax=Sesamum angolense TaxID=2727404 RepID=A0AAE1WXT2_9LAMI|nr:hypothetical protein Sango_1217300 [Sesamum angolense]